MPRTKDPSDILRNTDHRPWPTPEGRPWAMRMSWHRVLFVHWALDPAVMRPLVPSSLELDLYDQHAWIGVVPFEMHRVRPRFLPGVPGHTKFLELNVRTYVRHGDYFGVYFFSLDAQSVLAVEMARRTFYLPYFNAKMRSDVAGNERVRYASVRTDRRSPTEAQLDMSYEPVGETYRTRAGDLDHFLTERYCLFSVHPRDVDRVYIGHIHHEPWTLRAAEGEFRRNTMTMPMSIDLDAQAVDGPVWHYADPLDVVAWKLTRAKSGVEEVPSFAGEPQIARR